MEENVIPNGLTPASTPNDPKWTVMVYLAGDNNLTANCITVLQQLEAVDYSSKNVRVLACFDSNTPWPKGSRYFAISDKRRANNEAMNWELCNDLIVTEDRGHEIKAPDFCVEGRDRVVGAPMGRTEVAEGLRRFLKWAMKESPKSEHYMLVLYGHGPVVAGKTFLARENPVSSLGMQDISGLLERHFGENRKLDILALQNCAMNGIETAYEVKGQVDYMVGSQGLVLAYGWPYERIIKTLIDNPLDSPLAITEKMLKACARHLIDFSVMDRSSEQSVCDLTALGNQENIICAIQDLSRALQKALQFKTVASPKPEQEDPEQKVLEYPVICDAMRLARLEAQSFWGETFVDLFDFCDRLVTKCTEAIVLHHDLLRNLGLDDTLEPQVRETNLVRKLMDIRDCCIEVCFHISGPPDSVPRVKKMVPHSYYIGSELQYSRGLSIYFPWGMPTEPYSFTFNEVRDEHVLVTAFETYSSYKFVKDSGWGNFLKSFYRATLRKVRRTDKEITKSNTRASFSHGFITKSYKPVDEVIATEYLQKTDSNTGPVDHDVWSNVKNYPRRNYISPSDCPRKLETGGRYRADQNLPQYPNRFSPPVSYLGWNICEFVADVIKKKPPNSAATENHKEG